MMLPNIKLPTLSNTMKGVVWILLWCWSFVITMSIAKFLSDDVNTSTKVLMRSIFAILFLIPLFYKRRNHLLKTKQPFLHIVRSLTGTIAIWSTYYAYTHLPLSFAMSIGFSTPLIIIVLSAIVLSARINLREWMAVTIGYIGVIIVIRPDTMVYSWDIMAAILANIFAAITIVIIRVLSKKDDAEDILLIGNANQCIILLCAASFFSLTIPSGSDMILLVVMSLFGVFSQYAYIVALKYASPVLISPFEYNKLVCSIPIGILVFGEYPDLYVLLGGLVIVASVTYLTFIHHQKKKAEASLQKNK